MASPYLARDTNCLNCHMQTYTGRATRGGPLRNRLHRHDFIGVQSGMRLSAEQLANPAAA